MVNYIHIEIFTQLVFKNGEKKRTILCDFRIA